MLYRIRTNRIWFRLQSSQKWKIAHFLAYSVKFWFLNFGTVSRNDSLNVTLHENRIELTILVFWKWFLIVMNIFCASQRRKFNLYFIFSIIVIHGWLQNSHFDYFLISETFFFYFLVKMWKVWNKILHNLPHSPWFLSIYGYHVCFLNIVIPVRRFVCYWIDDCWKN